MNDSDYTITECPSTQIDAVDLSLELAGLECPVECARVSIEGSAEGAQAIYVPDAGRGALAWGADAVWTDAESMGDVVERVLGGEVIA